MSPSHPFPSAQPGGIKPTHVAVYPSPELSWCCKSKPLSHLTPYPSAPVSGKRRPAFSMNLTPLGASGEWNRTVLVLPCLAWFTEHNALGAPPSVARVRTPFLDKSQNICRVIDCILLTHSPVSAHLGCFQVLAPVNNAAVNLSIQTKWVFLPSGGNAADVITYLAFFLLNIPCHFKFFQT